MLRLRERQEVAGPPLIGLPRSQPFGGRVGVALRTGTVESAPGGAALGGTPQITGGCGAPHNLGSGELNNWPRNTLVDAFCARYSESWNNVRHKNRWLMFWVLASGNAKVDDSGRELCTGCTEDWCKATGRSVQGMKVGRRWNSPDDDIGMGCRPRFPQWDQDEAVGEAGFAAQGNSSD